MKTFNITQKATKSFLQKYIDLKKVNILKTSITLSLIAFVSLAWGQSDELNCPAGTIVSNTMTFNTANFTIVHAKGTDANFAAYSPWRVYTNNTVKFTAGPPDLYPLNLVRF